ncbi:hypothetical protein C0V97_11970 [Asaia sp. W19]|nr:hypothetical protein C0V97_11970 [Asaia sp. W19]
MASMTCRMADGERMTCTIFRVVTHHRTLISLDPQTREMAHLAPGAVTSQTIAMRWSGHPDFALLIGYDGDWPTEASEVQRGGWSPAFRACTVIDFGEGRHALKPYRGPRLLSAEEGTGRIYDNRELISDWELFLFDPVSHSESPFPGDLAEHGARLLGALDKPQALAGALAACPPSLQPPLLEMLCDMLSTESGQAFASLFVTDLDMPGNACARYCSSILATLPEPEWIRDGFRNLHQWQNGYAAPIRSADARYDFLGFGANTVAYGHYSFGARLLAMARQAVRPGKTLALLATARDEGLYLIEWIAHHRRIGVEQFFIYTNNLTDGSDVLLRRLAEAGEIIWIDNTGASPERINMQDKAYHHALMLIPDLLDYRWCLVVDLDEMVLPAAGFDYKLPPLLAAREREGAEVVTLSWRVFGANRRLVWAPGLSSERFVETEPNPLVKAVFRTSHFSGASPHHPLTRDRRTVSYMTIDGEKHSSGDPGDHDRSFSVKPTINGRICHYHVRSLEEYVWKFARGENDGKGVLIDKSFRYNTPAIFEIFLNRLESSGGQPALPLVEDIQRGVRQLMRLPGVQDACEQIVQRFKAQIRDFVEQSDQIMQCDDRIDSDVRARWAALVEMWREGATTV